MDISATTALFMVLFTTFLWGSWSQFVKLIDNWPLPAFIWWLYISGFVVTTVSILFLKPYYFPEGMGHYLRALPGKCLLVLVCGATYSIGTQLSMTVVKKAGIIFHTSINAMLTIPVGCAVSSILGGIPQGVSVGQIVLGVALLVTATMLCQKSARMRDADNGIPAEQGIADRKKYIVLLVVCAVVFAPTYTVALSLGTKAENGVQLPTPLLVWVLSVGSLLGTSVFSAVRLTIHHQWKDAFHVRKHYKKIGLACLAGLFHYGGNMIHTIASPVVSVAIAWPMGYLSNIWQYFWGLVRGEFRGARRVTMGVLFLGIACFIFSLITLASALYW